MNKRTLQREALIVALQRKEAEAQAAKQTIDLLVSSVRSLEASMSRLVGVSHQQQHLQQLGGGGDGAWGDVVAGAGDAVGAVPPPLFVRVDEDVSAKSKSYEDGFSCVFLKPQHPPPPTPSIIHILKSNPPHAHTRTCTEGLSEIDRLLHRLGFGGVLAAELATAEIEPTHTHTRTHTAGGGAAAAAAVPPAEARVEAREQQEEGGAAAAARNASGRLGVPSPPPTTKPGGATTAGRRTAAGGYPSQGSCPSSSADSGRDRRQQQQRHSGSSHQQQQQRKRGRCVLSEVGVWLTDVARFHEEKFAEGLEQAMRWFM